MPDKTPEYKIDANTMNRTQILYLLENHFDDLSKEDISLGIELIEGAPVPSIENFKSQARLFKALTGDSIKLGKALELLSHQYGKENWRTMLAFLNPGEDAEESIFDVTLFKNMIPALQKWRESNPGKGIICDESDPLNEHKLLKIFSMLIRRSRQEHVYISSVDRLLKEHADLFKGFDLEKYSAERQIQDEWMSYVQFMELAIKNKIPTNFPERLRALEIAKNESQSEHFFLQATMLMELKYPHVNI